MLVLMHGLKYVPQSFGDLPGDGNLKLTEQDGGWLTAKGKGRV